MKKFITICLLLTNIFILPSMHPSKKQCNRNPAFLVRPGETLVGLHEYWTNLLALPAAPAKDLGSIDREIAAVDNYLQQTEHPFAGTPDLLAPQGTSPYAARSKKQITADLIAQAKINEKLEYKK